MGFRVARKAAAAFAYLALLVGVSCAPVAAQQPGQVELFQLSGSCAVPDSTVASLAPLPNLAQVLRQRMQVRVLAVGNWMSFGSGTLGQHRFTTELEEILERSVKNLDLEFTHRGASGEPTSTTAERLKQDIALLDPDLVLWQVGSYDAMTSLPVSEFEATLSGAVDWIRNQGKDLVLVGLQYTRGLSKVQHYREIKDAVGRVAARHNVLLVRRYEAIQFIATAGREQAKLEQNDFRMTELGHKCLAEHIARALVINVFARRAEEPSSGRLAAGRPGAHLPATSTPSTGK